MITKRDIEAATEKMREVNRIGDAEGGHIEGDKLLIKLLSCDNRTKELVEIYEKLIKWYI